MQSSQVRNVGLPSSADTKRDVPAWTQDPKIFPLDWFSVSRPNIIRQTKEYVSELSKWRNCPKIKTLSKLKAVLKRIMMFLHTHISYIDGKSLLECDLEEDLITLVSLYMDMELRVLLIKKSAPSGASSTSLAGPVADADTARNDKLVSDRIAYWLYTVLTGHDQRVDALLSTTVFTRHTRPVLDPIFRKVLSEMSDGPFTNVNYVRHMLAYKTWRERTLVLDDTASLELNSRVLHQLVPRDYAFPPPLLRCLGKGDNAREHARPHNINLADACRNFMRYCREIPAAAAEQINFESIPLFDDDLLGDEEGEVNKIMNMISSRKQRKTAPLSPRRNSHQVDAFIDLTVPKSRTGVCGNPTSLSDVIDLTEEDEKPIITSRTAAVVEHSAPLRTPAVQRISTSKKQQPTQDCSYSMAPSTPQVETRCFTAYRDQDIYLVNISCMCPVRAHRQRECQCQDKKIGYHKENKALKALTERKCENDATFVGRCFQFSIGNQYAYPSEDDVETEMQPLVVGNSQDQVKLEMRASNAVTCNKDENRDEATEFCDKLFSASLNHCDCDGCKRRYENRTCSSAASNDSKTEISDNVQCRQKSLVTYSHTPSVADMYAMDKANPIVLHSQTPAQLPEDRNQVEYFSETLDKRKLPSNESNDYFTPKEDTLNNNFRNEIRKIKLPLVQTDKRPDNVILSNEDIFPVESEPIEEISKSTNITDKISTITETEDFSKETINLDEISETIENNAQNTTPPLVLDTRTEIEQLCSEITDLSYSELPEKEAEVTENTCNVLEKDCVPDETVNNNFEDREDIHCTDTPIEDQKIEEITDILPPGETNDLETVNSAVSNIENCTVAPIEDQIIEETVLLPEQTNDLEVSEEFEYSKEQEHTNEQENQLVDKEITITEETDNLTSKVPEEFENDTRENSNEQESIATDLTKNCETQVLVDKEVTITEENDTHLTSDDSKEFENCTTQEIRNEQESMESEISENCETQSPVDKEETITEEAEAHTEQNCLSNETEEISQTVEIETNISSEDIPANENKVIEEPVSNISVISEEKIDDDVQDDTPTEEAIIEETVNENIHYCFSEIITELNEEESISECLNLAEFTELVAIEANVSSEDVPTNEVIITEKPISVISEIAKERITSNVQEVNEETTPIEKTNMEEHISENENINYSDKANPTNLQVVEVVVGSEVVAESEIHVAGTHEIETTNQHTNFEDHVITDHSEDNNEDVSLKTEICNEIVHEIEADNEPVAVLHEIETSNQQTSSNSDNTDQSSTNKDYEQETEICTEIGHEIEATIRPVVALHEIETTNQQFNSVNIISDQLNTNNEEFVKETEICTEIGHEIEATTQPVPDIHEIETTNQQSNSVSIISDQLKTNNEEFVKETEICSEIGHEIEATTQPVPDIHEIETTNQQTSSDCITTDQLSTNKQDFVQETEIVHEVEATSQPVAAIHEIETIDRQSNSDSITTDQLSTNNEDFVQETEICIEFAHEIEATTQPVAAIHEVETTNQQSNSDSINVDQSSTNKEDFVQNAEICTEIGHEIEAISQPVDAIHEIETTNQQSNSDSSTTDQLNTNNEDFVQQTEISAEFVHEIDATTQPVAAIHEIETTNQQTSSDSDTTDQSSTNKDFVQETEICSEIVHDIDVTTQSVPVIHEIVTTNQQSNSDSTTTDQLITNKEDFVKETETCTEFHEIQTTNSDSNANKEDFVQETEIVPGIKITQQTTISDTIVTEICTDVSHEVEAIDLSVSSNIVDNSITNFEDFIPETIISTDTDQVIETIKQQPNTDSIVDTNFEDVIPTTEIVHVPTQVSKRKRRTSIRDHVEEEEEVQIDFPKMSPSKRRRCRTSIEAKYEEKEKIEVTLHEETSLKINNLIEISNSKTAEENSKVLEATSIEESTEKSVPLKESNLVDNTRQEIATKERVSKKRRKTNLKIRNTKTSLEETPNSEKIDSSEDKKLIVVCERLSLNDIEHLSKTNQTTFENDKKIPTEENINKMRPTSRRKNKITASTNNMVEDTVTQEITVDKNEQNKINLNTEKNNINKTVDIPSFSEFVSKEKEKQVKMKGRPRKKKQVDNNENTNKPSENQITSMIPNLADINTEVKIKRPRGRPPKNSFFSENLNLQNVNSKNTNVLVNGSDTHSQPIPDEDVPLLVRKSLSPKRYSTKMSQKNSVSDLENNIINNEDDLPLLSRKQKLKPNKIVKTYAAKTKLKKTLRKEGSECLIKQTELGNEIKYKSFRDKLNQFKYKSRSKTDLEDITTSPKKNLNSEKNSKRNVRTYANTKSFKRTDLRTTEYAELYPIPDIIQSTIIKPKKSVRFCDKVEMFDPIYVEDSHCEISETTKPEPKHENSTKPDTSPKNNKSSEMLLHRAERVKIKKFREIPDETNLQTGKDNKSDSDSGHSSNEIIDSSPDYSTTNKRKANSEEHMSNQPKFLNNFSCEVKITEKVESNSDKPNTVQTPIKNNCPLNPKKLFSKRAREKLELQTKTASENNISTTSNIEQQLNSKSASDEKIINDNPRKEVVNNNLQQFSISPPIEEKIVEIENKSIQELVCPNNKGEHLPRVAEEIVVNSVESTENLSKFHKNEMSKETTENVVRSPVKKPRKSKFPKLKLKLDSKSNFLPKNLRKNIKTSPTLKNRKKKKFKSKLNGNSNKNSNVKQPDESIELSDFSNKSELQCDKNIDQNDLDINKNNEIETSSSKPEVDKIKLDEIKDSKTLKEIVEENINKNLTQSSEILSNINDIEDNKNLQETTEEDINVNSTQSSKEVSSNTEFPNITIDKDEKTKLESPKIDKKSADMVYKPCNKIYEKSFDFYSDHDDGSNSELVIDTSAESSEAEDTITENKTQEIKNLVQNDIPVSKPKYHHLIEEIVNLNENTNKNIPINFEHVISHIPVVEETVVETLNYSDISDEPEKSDISRNMFGESFQKTEECIVDHHEPTDLSISVVDETIVENMTVEETVVGNMAVENIVEDENICVEQQNIEEKKKEIVEHTAEITEIPEEFFTEFHSEELIKEKLQLDLEPYGPSVEMNVKVEIGFESCTIFQKKLLEGEHAKEACVKCSVNGKHKNNRRVLVQGLPLYDEQNIVGQCLDDCPRILPIPYCQALENIEKSPCTLTAKVGSVKICKNDSIPVLDNSNLFFLAHIAMSSVHLTTKTDMSNPYPERPSDNNHNPNSMDIHDKCMIVTFPDDLKPSNKPTTTISVIKDKHTTIPVEVQTLAERIPPKGIVLENKIQEITLERVKNGNRVNGENLDELYKSLENICELEINTLTKTPESHSHLPSTIPTAVHDNPKISEPIPIDIPNTALLHLTPDDDDFMIRNEPFVLQPKQIQISPVKSPTEAVVPDKPNLDASGIVKNLFNVADSVTEAQKTDIKSTEQKFVNEKQPEVKTKSKRGRKAKSSANQNSETNYLFNVYKSNQDSNKNVDNNQQIVTNNKSSPSPQRYIRTTRPMKMVSTKKRNVNVLDNNQQDEPPKKVSASEKMFDLLLEEHRKEQSEAKFKSPEKNIEENVCTNNTTMPDLDDKIPETTVISTTSHNDEQHIPLPVLHFDVTETGSQKIDTEGTNKSEEVLKQKIDNQVDIQAEITEVRSNVEIIEVNKEITEDPRNTEITEIKTDNEIIETQTEKEIVEAKNNKEITEIQSDEDITEMLTDKEKQVEGDSAIGEEVPDSSDRNVSAIEVVQDWFNRVHDNKSHTEPYTEITSYQTIEECNFFEEMSNTSENSPNSRKTDDKFSEHQTPDSGIAFDEDSVQKDKSVPENLSDADGEAAATNFDDLDESMSESEKVVISDSQSSYENHLKVSISLERIQEILPRLKKYKLTTTEIKIRKRKDHDTEYEKAKKMKYSTEVEQNLIIEECTSDNDIRIKRRQSCNDDAVPDFSNEEIKSPTPSQKDLSAPLRTKGSVKEYPDCLFGITESPVPSGSFHSPYPSDISLTEEPTFYEEGGIDLCNDYPCYDSFEVLQEQQSLQKEYNVVDDNPKDVQQGLQAGYCVVDSQFLPLSEYMNDGDYILIDNKIFNDKKMVPVNMHLVQPETKPHNNEEVKKSEFDDSEKEDSLSDTVEEIIKNPNLFPEQSSSEVQVINMDQATSEVQVVIACGTYQETEMSDTYLFGIAVQSEVNNSDTSVPDATLPQHSPMTIEEIPPESKVTDNSDFKPTTPIVGSESKQICNTDILPATDVPQPESVDLLAVPDPIVTDNNKKKLPEHTAESKQLDSTFDIELKCKSNGSDETQKLSSDKVVSRRTSLSEVHVSNASSRTPAYSPSSQLLSKSKSPASNSIQPSSSHNSKNIPKPICTKSPKMSYELNTTSATKVFDPKAYNLKTSEKNPSTSNLPLHKVQKISDHHHVNKISVQPSSYSAQRLQNATQKQLTKKLTDLKMQQKPQMARQAEKTYSSKASEDAFDRLKHDKTDIPPPPDTRRFYSQSSSDPNYLKNRRKDIPSGDYYRRYSIDRDSSKTRHPSQSDIRRPHSSHAESNPKQSYRLPASDPSYRSSHNSRRPEVKKPDQKPPPSGQTSSQKDWLKNETLLNLIKASNTIFSKKY